MGHQLREIKAGVVYEVVRRTRNGRFAFAPTPALIEGLVAILKVAAERWPQVKVHLCEWLSNHFHALLSAYPPYATNAVAGWLNYVMAESAKLAQAIHGLPGTIWEKKRCRLIEILDDESLRNRTKYIMGQAVTAGLVKRPKDWLGLSTCDAVCRGEAMIGYLSTAKLRREAKRRQVPLSTIAPRRQFRPHPLPIHADWSDDERQRWYCKIEDEIITEAAEARGRRPYPTRAQLLAIDPHTEKALEDTPAPRFWASRDNHEARRTWWAKYRAFSDAWREALQAWIDGAKACFPTGGWVPFDACFAPGYAQRV